MVNAECPKNARRLGSLLIFIWGIFVAIGALTQIVGVNLGALVFIVMSTIWPAQAICRCENWGRIGYLISGPLALWMGLQALGEAEFLQVILYLLIVVSFVVYLVALIVLLSSKTNKAFLSATAQSKGQSSGRGFSVLLIALAGFLFAWWWANLSTALYLIGTRDLQGIFISLGGISIAVALGALFLRIWWSTLWSTVAGWILVATGVVLLEHALCYSVITVLVYLGGRESAFGMTGLIIGGRFLFAIISLVVGTSLLRGQLWIFGKKPKKQESIESAILKGDMRQVKNYLSGGLDVNAPLDSQGSRPIHYAVHAGSKMILLLIKHGADVNVKTSDGMAPIHIAAATANYESLRILVENGADVNLEDNEGRNALKHVFSALPIDKVYASWGLPMDPSEQQERQKIAKFLFEHGANISKNSPDADEVARVTGTSAMEVMRGFMLKLLSEGKNPFEPLSGEQRRQMAKQFPDVAERVRKQFGIQW